MPKAETLTFHNYCASVERDPAAHPIRRAADVIPEGVFRTGEDLYRYSVSAYRRAGTPLARSDSADDAYWIIFDNVYARTGRDPHPSNASVVKARAARFSREGKGRDPERAARLWEGAIAQWGHPLDRADPGAQAESSASPVLPRPAVATPLRALAPAVAELDADEKASRQDSLFSTWAHEVVRETRVLWERLRGDYAFSASGFNVFYSPVRDGTKVALVGANPGGGSAAFDVERASRIPDRHEYLAYDYPMARKMRDLFNRAGRPDLLAGSLKLNLNFFRSVNTQEWDAAPENIRREVETFCAGKAVEVLRRARPKLILAEGMATFDRLCELLTPGALPTISVRSGAARAFASVTAPDGTRLVGIIHPTGARYSSDTWTRVGEALQRELADL